MSTPKKSRPARKTTKKKAAKRSTSKSKASSLNTRKKETIKRTSASNQDQSGQRSSEDQANPDQAVRDTAGRWQKGTSGNANGRPKGSGTAMVKVKGRDRSTDKLKRGPGKLYKKGTSGNPKGRPPGSKGRSTVMADVMALAYEHAPALAENLVHLGLDKDRQAAKIMMDLALNGSTCWKFKTKRLTMEDLAEEFRAVQDGLASGDLSQQHAEALCDSLDRSKVVIEATGGSDRRSAFETEAVALRLIQRDPNALKAASYLVRRFATLNQRAIESGELPGAVSHPLIDIAKAGVEGAEKAE